MYVVVGGGYKKGFPLGRTTSGKKSIDFSKNRSPGERVSAKKCEVGKTKGFPYRDNSGKLSNFSISKIINSYVQRPQRASPKMRVEKKTNLKKTIEVSAVSLMMS
jgi:hypothetical protein